MSTEINGSKWATWDDVRREIFAPEEIAESDRRIARIGEADGGGEDAEGPGARPGNGNREA